MWKDPIVEEVRNAGKELQREAKCKSRFFREKANPYKITYLSPFPIPLIHGGGGEQLRGTIDLKREPHPVFTIRFLMEEDRSL